MTRFDQECWICEVQSSIVMDSGGGGGSQPSGQTTTVQKADPWSGQQPFLQTGFQQVQDLYNSGGPQYYSGQTYAGPTDAQNNALNSQIALGSAGSPLAGAAQSAGMGILDPSFLQSNPGNAVYNNLANGQATQDAINTAVQKATPGLMDAFTQGNRMNSPGAAFAVSQGITSAAAPYVLQGQQAAAQGLSGNYQGAAQLQNQASLIAPQTQQMPYTDISNMYNAGATQQSQNQAGINDAMTRYNYNQTLPYNMADWYNAGVGGSYGGTQTLTSPYFTQPQGGLMGALTGAVGGGALGYMLGGQQGAMYGAGGGGLLGGLL